MVVTDRCLLDSIRQIEKWPGSLHVHNSYRFGRGIGTRGGDYLSAVSRTRAKTFRRQKSRRHPIIRPPSRVACVKECTEETCKLTIATLDGNRVVAPRSP